MIQTVFLDLDNTILDFTHAEAVALRRALLEAGRLPEERARRLEALGLRGG